MPRTSKKHILFVGSFKKEAKDGSVGGQMFSCKAILDGTANDSIDWKLLDTTADSNILSSNFNRISKAIFRLFKFYYYLLFFRFDYFLIFLGGGWSFWEKGLMAVSAKIISRGKVIIAPRSGFIIIDLSNRKMLGRFIQMVFQRVDTVICQSLYWKKLFEDYACQSTNPKFIVIENIIDFDLYSGFIAKKGGENKKVIILFLAWVTRKKGIFELLEAVKRLYREKFNFELLIAGKGEDYVNVENEIKNSELSNCVTLRGWVRGEEKLELLAQTDIFVLPTHFDGYPNSLIEAMASSCACISTKVGSIPDIISNMENGVLVEKENTSQLYEVIKILINNPELRRELSNNARGHVKKINSVEEGIIKFRDLFR
jgi:glycosyltransferase involved in cell wall biosynthesis